MLCSRRPLTALELTAKERQQLSGYAALRSLPHALDARAWFVSWAAEGVANQLQRVWHFQRLQWARLNHCCRKCTRSMIDSPTC
jgi:hypothetical protein